MQIFPKFKKVQNILGEGGQEDGGLFPLFVTFFNSEASLIISGKFQRYFKDVSMNFQGCSKKECCFKKD